MIACSPILAGVYFAQYIFSHDDHHLLKLPHKVKLMLRGPCKNEGFKLSRHKPC